LQSGSGVGRLQGGEQKERKSSGSDENAEVRKELQLHGSVNVHDRLVKSPHFAHNKFVVFCDKQGKPSMLWTGSTNWTLTGLCTQVNNGVLIASPKLALAYRNRWEALKDARAGYPASLAQDGSTPAEVSLGSVDMTAWNAPVLKLVEQLEPIEVRHSGGQPSFAITLGQSLPATSWSRSQHAFVSFICLYICL
jgi:phosphatidylserine/phosphatidylglycerophosphate/cardiolipin synthase-like enzyme